MIHALRVFLGNVRFVDHDELFLFHDIVASRSVLFLRVVWLHNGEEEHLRPIFTRWYDKMIRILHYIYFSNFAFFLTIVITSFVSLAEEWNS